MAEEILVVATTVGSVDAARSLARRILDARLAACVQIDFPVNSLYRWEGKLCDDTEARLVAKTVPACRAPLEALVAEHHPYELPQFVAWTAQASTGYARWVREQVQLPA